MATKQAKTPTKVAPKPAKKTGRPSSFNEEKFAEICARLAEGEPLRQICRDPGMPHWNTVYAWEAAIPGLSERIARARERGEEAIAQQCLEIADTPLIGEEITRKPDGGIEVKQGDMLGHRKLQIDTRLKLLAKWNPRKWGEKVDVNHGGQENNPVQVATKVVIVPAKAKAEVTVKPLESTEK